MFGRVSKRWEARLVTRSWLKVIGCLGPALLHFLGPGCLTAKSPVDREYEWKARYLAEIPNFVEWPADAIPSGQESFRLCAVGDFPFGISLAQAAGRRAYRNRRIDVRLIRNLEETRSCQILFVSKSERKRYTQILESLSNHVALTVGETPDFLDAGGMMSFSMEKQTLRFDVNLAAAAKAHLKFSSQLLALARHVWSLTVPAKS